MTFIFAQFSLSFKETGFIVFVCNFISYNVLLDSFALLFFFPFMHLVRIEFSS